MVGEYCLEVIPFSGELSYQHCLPLDILSDIIRVRSHAVGVSLDFGGIASLNYYRTATSLVRSPGYSMLGIPTPRGTLEI